jgi:phospholipid N-methyltransferase
MSKSDLLVELYTNLTTTGAVTFSSKALVKKMLSFTDLTHAELVVELGGGDGSVTQGIVERLSPKAELLVFEINPSFCAAMKKQFPQPNVKIINDSAEHISNYTKGKKVDYVLSSLPFSLIPKDAGDQIMKESRDCLKPTGKFIQICYSYLLKKLFLKYFSRIEVKFTMKNLPPAFVMICH